MAIRKICTKCRKKEERCKCRSPTWRFQIDYYDPAGKRVRKDFEKKSEAEDEMAARRVSKSDGSYFKKAKTYTTTLKELLKKYKENYKQQASYETWKRYCHENFKKYFGEDTPLANITYMDVETYRNHLRQKPTKYGSVRKDATVNREMACLRHLFTKAKEWKMIKEHPFEDGKSLQLKEDNERVR